MIFELKRIVVIGATSLVLIACRSHQSGSDMADTLDCCVERNEEGKDSVCGGLVTIHANRLLPVEYAKTSQLTRVWFKYDTPVNGYEVLMHCVQNEKESSFFTADFYLTKNGKIMSFRQNLCFDSWEPWCLEGVSERDTQYLHNTHESGITQKLDWRNILYFEDMDFDGKNEMVVCGFVRPQREYGDCLDCEDFTIYKIGAKGICRVRNVPFDKMEEGLCRTVFLFDKKRKIITLTGICSTFDAIEEKYWFKNGKPYAMDYNIIDKNKGNTYHHWNIDGVESDDIFRRMDSVNGYY